MLTKNAKIAILAVTYLLVMGITYQATSTFHVREMQKQDTDISALSSELKTLNQELAALTKSRGVLDSYTIKGEELPTGGEWQPYDITEGMISNDFCFACHGEAQMSEFHIPIKIKAIDEENGVNPRLCDTCHGSNSHDIHRILMSDKRMICQTCHVRAGSFVVPEPKRGQILPCEPCHAQGDYIKIHIDGEILYKGDVDEKWMKTRTPRLQCTNCHMGRIMDLHRTSATGGVGNLTSTTGLWE